MTMRVKVNSKNQIAVPAAVREHLKIESGDHLLMTVRGGTIVLVPEPRDYAAALRGLGSEVWEGVDPDDYIRREREAWPD